MQNNNNFLALSRLFGNRNFIDAPNTRAGIGYLNAQSNLQNAQNILNESNTPVGSIGAGINYYLAAKNNRKALDELAEELKAQDLATQERKIKLASLLPENQREAASALDIDHLSKLALENLSGTSGLNQEYKQAQIDRIRSNAGGAGNNKPLPAPALKSQSEDLEGIGIAKGINADLENIEKQIDNKELKLGPAENLKSEAKNYIGKSDANSQNYASFKATLEKQRNDSLRLNKGVQTEGDAVRAWNELFTNINDSNVVKKRLSEIREINSRAANIKKQNVKQIRQNYGVAPINFDPYENQPAAIGNTAPQNGGGIKIISIRNK